MTDLLFISRWIPDNVSVTLCSVPPVGQKQSAYVVPLPVLSTIADNSFGSTCLANSTAIQEVFKRNLSQVNQLTIRPLSSSTNPSTFLVLGHV